MQNLGQICGCVLILLNHPLVSVFRYVSVNLCTGTMLDYSEKGIGALVNFLIDVFLPDLLFCSLLFLVSAVLTIHIVIWSQVYNYMPVLRCMYDVYSSQCM